MLFFSTSDTLDEPFDPAKLKFRRDVAAMFGPSLRNMVEEAAWYHSNVAFIQDSQGSLGLVVMTEDGIKVNREKKLFVIFPSRPIDNETWVRDVLEAMEQSNPPIQGLLDFLGTMIRDHVFQKDNDTDKDSKKIHYIGEIVERLQTEHRKQYKQKPIN